MSRAARTAIAAVVLAAAIAGCGGSDSGSAEREPPREREPAPERSAPSERAAGSRPNIVVVMTDDQDFRSIRVMDRVRRLIGRRGTTFARAYATFPLCCPARATLLTGRYAHNHGVRGNKPPEGGFPAFEGQRHTVGVWLQQAGYRTAWIGKYLNVYGHHGDYPIPPGWSRWHVFVEQRELRMYDYQLNENGTIRYYGTAADDYQTDVLARKAARFIDSSARRDRPFFLVLSPLAPHDEDDKIDTGDRDPRPAPRHHGAPIDPAAMRPVRSFDEADISDKAPRQRGESRLSATDRRELRRLRRSRLESLLAVDEAVGRLVRTLRRRGVLDETVFVFTSDNGYMLGEHREIGGKSLPYEEVARVPLLIRGPGFPAGERRRQIIGNIDLAPTFLELAGATPSREPDGVSLLAAAADPEAGADRALLLESGLMRALRTPRWLYVEYSHGGHELYDMEVDPLQLDSVAGRPEHAEVEADLAERLRELRDCVGAGCRD